MRSKGSRFTLGVWRLSCVRQTLRNRSQPSATVRNRSQPFATVRNRPQPFASVRARSLWPCLWEVLLKGVPFGAFPRRIASFRVAGVALCDIPTCFMTCQESFCAAGTIVLGRFQKMCCIFRGRCSTLDTSDVIFLWQVQHFGRVLLCVLMLDPD